MKERYLPTHILKKPFQHQTHRRFSVGQTVHYRASKDSRFSKVLFVTANGTAIDTSGNASEYGSLAIYSFSEEMIKEYLQPIRGVKTQLILLSRKYREIKRIEKRIEEIAKKIEVKYD